MAASESEASAAGPPALVKIAVFRPDGNAWQLSAQATSNRDARSGTSITPACLKAAWYAVYDPANDPV